MHLHLRRRSAAAVLVCLLRFSLVGTPLSLLLLLFAFRYGFLFLPDLTPKPLTRTYALRVAMEC